MILLNTKSRLIFLLLAIVLCCLPAACSSGKDARADGSRVHDINTSENPASAVVSPETTVNALDQTVNAPESTVNAVAAVPAKKADTAGTAAANTNTAADAAVVQEVTGNASKASPDKTTSNVASADSGAGSEPGKSSEAEPSPGKSSEPKPTDAMSTEQKSSEAKSSDNDKLIGKDSEYSFFLDVDKSVYAIDSAGKRTDCTMLSEYSGWVDYFEFNSDIYILSDSAEVRKASSIPPGDMFLGGSDFHIYYICADFSKAYSIDEYGVRHDSPITLFGGNYYFALDSSIYTVMTNVKGLRKLYSEHQIEIGSHYEHVLVLSRIENGIIYYSDESTGDRLDCQYDMAENKAYDIDPETGEIYPR